MLKGSMPCFRWHWKPTGRKSRWRRNLKPITKRYNPYLNSLNSSNQITWIKKYYIDNGSFIWGRETQSVIKWKVSQSAIKRKASQSAINRKVSQSAIKQKVSQSAIKRNVSQSAIKRKVSQLAIKRKASQSAINRKVSQSAIKRKVSQSAMLMKRKPIGYAKRKESQSPLQMKKERTQPGFTLEKSTNGILYETRTQLKIFGYM